MNPDQHSQALEGQPGPNRHGLPCTEFEIVVSDNGTGFDLATSESNSRVQPPDLAMD